MNREENASGDSTSQRPVPALVSIVIPFYNEEEVVGHLRKKLLEVIARIDSAVEIVLVNDGSADGTADGTAAELQRWAATG